MPMSPFRRQRTRREVVAKRADDLLGRTFWRVTCWYGRQLKAALRPSAARWSAIAGGAGVTAALGTVVIRRHARAAAAPPSGTPGR